MMRGRGMLHTCAFEKRRTLALDQYFFSVLLRIGSLGKMENHSVTPDVGDHREGRAEPGSLTSQMSIVARELNIKDGFEV